MQTEGDCKNLTKSIFSFKCQKRGKNLDKEYQGHLLANYLVLTQETDDVFNINTMRIDDHKYRLPIELSTHIKWEVQEFQLQNKKLSKLVSFKFQQIKIKADQSYVKIICFRAEEESLKILKDKIRNRVIFQRIQDVYTPLQTIGVGSSARVLLVRNKNTEVYYAAKCIDKTYINDAESGMESMFQEISISRKMDHPSFVSLHAVYEGDNTFYMVMDLVEGKSLNDEMSRHRQGFPLEICKMIMLQMLKGVDYLHDLGIMHRDLKPENMMFLKKNDLNSLKIVDFGLATYQDAKQFFFPKCGTPGYVAPEIANLLDKTKRYGKACDIFSLGVVFFKILTSQDLFPGQGFNVVLKLNKQCRIDPSPLLLQKVPQPVINLILRMLEKDPDLRITAKECLDDPFFEEKQILVIQPSAAQKKSFFQILRTDKLAQSAEFDQNTDVNVLHRSTNKYQIKSQNPSLELTGSFMMKENPFKSVMQPTKYQKIRFNTTEFDQHIQQKTNNQEQDLPEWIEEEEEKL